MLGGLGDIGKIPELKKRILYTLGLLAVYRLGVFVSTPGIDVQALKRLFEAHDNALFGYINLFSGGALEHFSIFTLGITPYISVSIILQVLSSSLPYFESLKKEGESGRRVIVRYTRLGTVALAMLQSFMIASGLVAQGLVVSPGWYFFLSTMFTLTAGTTFIMWLGEQITERGIGNGISVIIFSGIVARMPGVLFDTIQRAREGDIQPLTVLILVGVAMAVVAAIIFVERGQRKIPVQYPRRMVGKNLAQAQTQYMPLKVNMAGVMPPIFANAFLVLPATVASFSTNEVLQRAAGYLSPGHWGHDLAFVVTVVIFAYFFNSIQFNPEEIAENLKKQGGFIPTVRPGKQTAEYLYAVVNRLTLWGAIYIAGVCLLPQMLFRDLGALQFSYVFGGTAILIVVGVTLDTAAQIESHIVARNYEAFMSSATKKRGGLGSMSYQRTRLTRR